VALMAGGWLGCFGVGDTPDTLPQNFKPQVVLSDAGVLLGGDGGISGWRVSSTDPERFAPSGDGQIVAAAEAADGIVVISAGHNGVNPQLWSHAATGWSMGPKLSHGPINQLIVGPDGSLWTEGDRGVFRSTDGGQLWTAMPLPRNLRLGTVKLGRSGARLAYAGPELMVTVDNGTSWTAVDATSVVTTDGTWVVSDKDDVAMRVGRIIGDQVEWTAEVEGAWNPVSIRGSSKGVRILAIKKLSTQVELLQGDEEGRGFVSTRIDAHPEWVGLGERVMWLDKRGRINTLP